MWLKTDIFRMRFIICASGIVTQPLLCFASLHRSRFLSYVDWVLVVRGGGAYANVAMRPLPTFEKFHDTRPGALTRVSTVVASSAAVLIHGHQQLVARSATALIRGCRIRCMYLADINTRVVSVNLTFDFTMHCRVIIAS